MIAQCKGIAIHRAALLGYTAAMSHLHLSHTSTSPMACDALIEAIIADALHGAVSRAVADNIAPSRIAHAMLRFGGIMVHDIEGPLALHQTVSDIINDLVLPRD